MCKRFLIRSSRPSGYQQEFFVARENVRFRRVETGYVAKLGIGVSESSGSESTFSSVSRGQRTAPFSFGNFRAPDATPWPSQLRNIFRSPRIRTGSQPIPN